MGRFKWIDPEEFAELIKRNGAVPAQLSGWGEFSFGIFFAEKNLVILIGSSFDRNGQRPIGADSIRVLLLQTSEDKEPKIVWQMKPTKRIESWATNLQTKLDTLKKAARELRQCPTCKTWMRLRHKNYRVFLGCSSFPTCRQPTLPISPELEKLLLRDSKIR
ncbi:hypothetical protein A3B18_02945 [Candidatus Giovannonibacteria bacterium RIFCSPLOWO2_01_FULL_46_13]|uniref:DNA topoisomerase type IA zn finger domain-containing protein n=1 Tax=Candidatus Giovannonibacteria bacterium RIFCSPLOWO2_01_FULL_46_13 TaxID=1798352 RepID=A0A1F5X364_9BACT|nr:MAG: hypothetical protein A3B18_02945 [Candidatus Giovannonibacteria bacterium RIFCSPLOWO2_01_FULL_46_13]